MNVISELSGNALRIIKFLHRQKKGVSFSTRGNIVRRFYIANRYPDKPSNPDEDIDFLKEKGLIEREEKNLWLTDLAINQYVEYQVTETNSILTDIINVNYEFALLKYLNQRNEFVNAEEFSLKF